MPSGQNVLVQMLPLAPVSTPDERAARDKLEKVISLETISAAAAGDPILAHKALGGDHRTLVWLLPFAELARPKIRTVQELLGLAIGLAAQLEERHQRGRTAPLLSEHALTAHARIVGAQVFAHGPWLAKDVVPVRAAPEELRASRALLSGDVWRLGQLLSELARQFALPPEVSRLLHPDPAHRPTATEALEQLDAAFSRASHRSTPPPKLEEEEEVVLLVEPKKIDTLSEEPEALDLAEPLPVPRQRSWIAPLSLAIAGLSAGALLSMWPG